MPGEAAFWRNVILIAIAHLALLITLLYWRGPMLRSGVQPVLWLTAQQDQPTEAAPASSPQSDLAADESPSLSTDTQAVEENQPVTSAAKSEIELPTETPNPTPAPKPYQKPMPKPTPKPAIKTKKKAAPAASAHSSEKPKPNRPSSTLAAKERIAAKTTGARKTNNTGGTSNRLGEAADSSVLTWYSNMLHDRFYREWTQPTTVVAAGAKLSALVKIRIEKDGRISDFKITRSSGNIVVDESIAELGKRVTKVDALPASFAGRDHYDVSINFELNPAQ